VPSCLCIKESQLNPFNPVASELVVQLSRMFHSQLCQECQFQLSATHYIHLDPHSHSPHQSPLQSANTEKYFASHNNHYLGHNTSPAKNRHRNRNRTTALPARQMCVLWSNRDLFNIVTRGVTSTWMNMEALSRKRGSLNFKSVLNVITGVWKYATKYFMRRSTMKSLRNHSVSSTYCILLGDI